MMFGMGYGYYIVAALAMGLSMFVSGRLKSKFKFYSQMPTSSGLSGKEIAEKMLADSNIHDVQVISTAGQLTDHYNPLNKTVNLSEVVYHERNVAAAAVAAHEVGHAIQHSREYAWLDFRSKVVPAVQFSSRYMQWVILAGFVLLPVINSPVILAIGIAMFAITTLFAFITLPVEYDASNRALAWLDSARITNGEEHEGAKDALKWAARTYLAAALGSLATLVYWILRYQSMVNRN